MARASYRAGVEWIGFNDEPGETDEEEMSGLISVLLLADLFAKKPEVVAKAVIRWRRKNYKTVGWPDRKGPR